MSVVCSVKKDRKQTTLYFEIRQFQVTATGATGSVCQVEEKKARPQRTQMMSSERASAHHDDETSTSSSNKLN